MHSDHSISHHESHCPVNGCPVCMPPIAIGVSPREYEALQSIAKAARAYFREFDHLIGDWDEHAYRNAAASRTRSTPTTRPLLTKGSSRDVHH